MQWNASRFWCRKSVAISKQELVQIVAHSVDTKKDEATSIVVSHAVTIITGVIEAINNMKS